jgi:hypothetical protein
VTVLVPDPDLAEKDHQTCAVILGSVGKPSSRAQT